MTLKKEHLVTLIKCVMNKYSVIKLSEYTAPKVEETIQKEWVEYKVVNDNKYKYPTGYYSYLIDRSKYSVTNGAVIDGYAKFIYGEGLKAEDASTKPEQWLQLKKLIKPTELKKAINDRKKLMIAALQVTKNKGNITDITHFPVKTLLPEKMNDDGEIEAWYYHPDWKNKKAGDAPTRIPSYGFGGKTGNEIYIIKAYNAGSDYFGSDDGYTGCLAYAVLEQEIADFQINDAQNGFTPTTVVNFNNGVPDETDRQQTKLDVENKLTGSTGKKLLISFNDDETKKATIDKVSMDNAPEHYDYLSTECVTKILAGHKAPSELLGFNENSGFSNNAEELRNKLKAFIHYQVQPYQIEFLDAINELLAVNDISLKLYFESLEPQDFKDAKEITDQTTLKSKKQDLSDEEGDIVLGMLQGEVVDDEWELVDTRYHNEDNGTISEWANGLIREKKKTLAERLGLSSVKSKPSRSSKLDSDIYKIRYSYQERHSSGKSRSFCANMMKRTSKGVVYRYEDIVQASFKGVNRSHGHKGMPYSLFKFKGGVNCGHYWQEELYRLKKKTDGTFYEDKSLSSSEEVDKIPKKNYKGDEVDTKKSQTAPKDMPRNGRHPNS